MVIGTDVDVDMLIKQIYKLPNVIKVEDLTYTPCVERGLVLIKVAAGAEHRGEVLDLAGIFRANAIDVSEKSITLAVTGDPGKTRAFQRTINKFGVLAVARTGKARDGGLGTLSLFRLSGFGVSHATYSNSYAVSFPWFCREPRSSP